MNLEHQIVNLGKAIKSQRQKLSLSQTQLAHLSGVSLNFISQMESGKPRMQFIKILQVLKVLGLQMNIDLGTGGIKIEQKILAKK